MRRYVIHGYKKIKKMKTFNQKRQQRNRQKLKIRQERKKM